MTQLKEFRKWLGHEGVIFKIRSAKRNCQKEINI